MAEEAEKPNTNDTFHVKGFRENEANLVFYTAPFAPEIEYQDDNIKVTFNEGYIYDHANMTTTDFEGKTSDSSSIPRIKVTELEHTHAEGEKVEYSIEIKRNKKTGEVIEAKIIKSADKSNSAKTFRNFIVENEIQGDEFLPDIDGIDDNGNDSYVYMDLAEFDGFEIKELYVRENIHVYYRGFEQLFNRDDDRVDDCAEGPIPILNSTGISTGDPSENTSTGANGMIGVRAIVRAIRPNTGSVDGNGNFTPPDFDDPTFTNILTVEHDEKQIYLYVPSFDDRPLTDLLNLEGTSPLVHELTGLRHDFNEHVADASKHCPCD